MNFLIRNRVDDRFEIYNKRNRNDATSPRAFQRSRDDVNSVKMLNHVDYIGLTLGVIDGKFFEYLEASKSSERSYTQFIQTLIIGVFFLR